MSDYIFEFDDFAISGNDLLFRFHYEHDAKVIGSFEEKFVLPVQLDTQDATIRHILRHMHLVVGVSYYKSLLGSIRSPYQLSEAEADYHNTIYNEGLGEFAFINKLTDDIKPFAASHQPDDEYQAVSLDHQGAILGIGGGKDSIVAAEIVKAIKLDTTVLDVATRDNHGQADVVMNRTGLPQLRVGRYLDRSIIDFTAEHEGMNGHVPLSALLAWVGVLLAYATGKRYIMMANEAASSSGNVMWNGREVNHQWSKSYEAEKLSQDFIHQHISPDLTYFSPIRPYGSLAVLALFAKVGRTYYDDFTSCNLVLRIDPAARPNGRWCTHCAKCLSTWLLLSSSMSIDQLSEIFGRNLFEDPELRPTLEALLGLAGHKPLDCVGTIEELRAVTRLVIEKDEKWPLLEGITTESIDGPSIEELTNERSPSNFPTELAAQIDDFVTQSL